MSETGPQGLGAFLRNRAGRPSARAMLRCLGYSATIACAALAGCDSRQPYSVPLGEARPVDYRMADLLAGGDDRAAKLARQSLPDGYLSANEASNMWAAYYADKDVRDRAEKAQIIKRWSK